LDNVFYISKWGGGDWAQYRILSRDPLLVLP
jgi:hypothetical protein